MSRKTKKNTRRKSAIKPKRRSISAKTSRSKTAERAVGRFVVPLLIIATLLAAILFMAFSGYQTVTASEFFALQKVEVSGVDRTPVEDIRRIVVAEVEKPGVWNADLGAVREKLEKFPFVKTASVSRSLPSGINVTISERVPAAVVSLSSGKYLVDNEGTVLTTVKGEQQELPFVLKGWDESKTEVAIGDNLARLKLYKKMLEEWQQFDLASRVKEVNIANPRIPVATVEDSGRAVGITLSRDNLGRGLKTAIEALSGKGDRVRAIDAAGVHPVIQYLEF